MDEQIKAFSPPHAMTAGVDPRDRISVRDYIVSVEIGAFSSERGVTQRIRFNVVLEVAAHTAASTDDVDKVLSYDTITAAIDTQLATERINLLETLAERVAERLLDDRRVYRAFVRIEKLDRIPGALGIEIVRTRRDAAVGVIGDVAEDAAQDVPAPQVVLISNAVMASPARERWIDAISSTGTPTILCLEVMPGFDSDAPGWPGRRVALLSVEQNAWSLASGDDRCKVVASRTELDYVLKEGQLAVWAPSKIVTDTLERPNIDPRDAFALVHWFAGQVEARRIVAVGDWADRTEGTETLHIAQDEAYICD